MICRQRYGGLPVPLYVGDMEHSSISQPQSKMDKQIIVNKEDFHCFPTVAAVFA